MDGGSGQGRVAQPAGSPDRGRDAAGRRDDRPELASSSSSSTTIQAMPTPTSAAYMEAAEQHQWKPRGRDGSFDDRAGVLPCPPWPAREPRGVVADGLRDHVRGRIGERLDLAGPPLEPHLDALVASRPRRRPEGRPRATAGACSIVAPGATIVIDRSASGRTFSATCVMTPSVPSDPVMSRCTSYPVTFFTVRAPLFTTRPSPVTSSISTTVSRSAPTRSRRARGRARGDHAADGRVLGGVGGPFLAVLGEQRCQLAAAHARLHDDEHLGRLVGDHLIELGGPQLRVDLARVALVDVPPPSDDEHASARSSSRRAGRPRRRTRCAGGSDPRALRQVGGVGRRVLRYPSPRARTRRIARRRAAPCGGSCGRRGRTPLGRRPARRGPRRRTRAA